MHATTDSILHSNAQAFIVPMPQDGIVINPVLTRLLQSYPQAFALYKQRATKGELALGEVLTIKVQKQATGLMAGSKRLADVLIFVITHHHHTHAIKVSALITACQTLNPELFKLMRYDNLRYVAVSLGAERDTQTADTLWQIVNTHLTVSRIRVEVHFNKAVDLSQFGKAGTTDDACQ